jgi:hypothetical protein
VVHAQLDHHPAVMMNLVCVTPDIPDLDTLSCQRYLPDVLLVQLVHMMMIQTHLLHASHVQQGNILQQVLLHVHYVQLVHMILIQTHLLHASHVQQGNILQQELYCVHILSIVLLAVGVLFKAMEHMIAPVFHAIPVNSRLTTIKCLVNFVLLEQHLRTKRNPVPLA